MGEIIYEAVDITAGYGKKIILQNLSLALERGGCKFVIGANGCGKSTLFSVMAGIKKAVSGQLIFHGETDGKAGTHSSEGERAGAGRGALSVNTMKEKRLGDLIGYVPQENPLFPELTVRDNLILWYGGKAALQREMEGGVVEKLGLLEVLKKQTDTLSGGMKRRACIACAMAGNPPILLMDEPGAALDIECKEILYAWLKEYRAAGGTVLLSSHEKAEWEMGDKVYLLRDGKLQEWEV